MLREATIYRRKQDEEERAQKLLQIQGRDEKQFQLWQQEMREKEKQERALEIERRKLEMQLAREYAIDAKEQKEAENKEQAAQMKKELEQLEEEKQRRLHEQEEVNRAIVSEFQQIQGRVRKAMEEYAQRNKEAALELQREKSELQARAAQEAHQEKLLRCVSVFAEIIDRFWHFTNAPCLCSEEFIRSIKEMEAARKLKIKKALDESKTSGMKTYVL